jgi:hypothetical protein
MSSRKSALAEWAPSGGLDDCATQPDPGLGQVEFWEGNDEPDDTQRRMERQQRLLRERFRAGR